MHRFNSVVGSDITLFLDARRESTSLKSGHNVRVVVGLSRKHNATVVCVTHSRHDARPSFGCSHFSISLLKKLWWTRRNTLPLQVLPVRPRRWSHIACEAYTVPASYLDLFRFHFTSRALQVSITQPTAGIVTEESAMADASKIFLLLLDEPPSAFMDSRQSSRSMEEWRTPKSMDLGSNTPEIILYICSRCPVKDNVAKM